MKTHTKDFKEQIKNLGRQLDSKLTYTIDGVTKTLTNEDLNSVTPVFQGAILKSVMKELDIDSNVDIPIGTILRYKFGVLVGDEYEYLDYGNYVVYSSKKQEDYNSYKIVCYDKMLYSMKQNEDIGVTYPISVRDYIDALCTKIGLEFKNKTDVFANYDKMITKELYVGQEYTYRDIFDELSQVTASTICLDIDDKVEIRYINKLTDLQIAEGTNITITDSEQDTINSLTLDGVCEQNTTTGKNLLDYVNNLKTSGDGLTSVINEDGSITTTGKPSVNYSKITNEIIITSMLEDGQTYTISQTNASNKVHVQVLAKRIVDGKYIYINSVKGSNTFKVDKTIYTNYSIMLQTNTISSWGDSPLTITNKYMLCKGTDTADTSFEPYTGGQPSPSPDYPQEIKTIENSLKITSCNKNFAYLKDGTYTKENDTAIINNNLITLNTSSSTGSNSYFSFGNGYTQTWAPAGDGIKNVNDLKLTGDGGNYIATIYTNKTISGSISFRIYTSNNRELMTNIGSYMTSTINISLEDGEHIKDYGLWSGSSLIFNDYQIRVQLEKGTTATPYEQHLETQINAKLPEGEFIGKINDTYKDTLNVVYKEDGHYHLILNKMIGKVVLDGTENWYVEYQTYRFDNFNGKSYSSFDENNPMAFSNYFRWANGTSGNFVNGAMWYVLAGNKLVMQKDENPNSTTLANFKSWLSIHNTEVYYALATPYEVDLGIVDEMLNTYKGTTHIFNSVDTNMSVTYVNGYETIDEEFLNDVNVNVAKKYGPVNSIVLSRSAESDNVYLKDEDSVTKNGLCELKIVDNQIMNWNDRSDYLPDILNKLDGLEYYINDFVSTGVAYLELCDNYKLKVFDNIYNCILLNDELDVTQGLVENIHTDMPMETETDYTKADKTDRRINQTSLIVDKQTQEITALVSKTDNLETKTAQLRLDVDTIEGQISDIADVTTTSEGVGTLVMQNINESEPIYLKIYPKLGDIKYLYPAEDLYPSDTLLPKVKTLRFHCTSENYDAEYELSKDLLWLNNDAYDEFILDSDNSACYVIRRVGVNADGTKYALTNSTQEDLTYPTIRLINGDYEVSLVGQPNAYLYVRLMVQNIYTTQFATKVELNSTIKQTKDEIDLEVSKKVGNDEVISKINQTAETITIQANKVNISGMISAINNNTTTTINGDKITTGSITANKVSSDIITTNNFNAQKINADNITSGTLSADKISGGTITASNINLKGVSLTPSTSSIGGLNVVSGTISNNRMGLDTVNGILRVFNNNGGSMILSNAARLSATAGVGISSNSNGNISAPSKNLDLKACSGAVAYLGCMSDASGKNERSAISCENGTLKLRSTGAIYANGVAIGGSSSKATKENIKDLSQEKKDELYNLIKNIPLKEYDYKEQYGKKENYGFIIEDIENTKLNTLLHIVQNKNNKDMKNYSSEDLVRLELVIIQELMKKNEMLEKRIEKLERNDK